jgi:hypothetical protein
MKFARWSFLIAGIWGILVLTPLYFVEKKTGIDHPPAITHPEYYYGFVGVALAWQVLFLIIARDPQRFRAAMLPAMIEKFSFVISTYVLYALGRVDSTVVAAASADLVLGTLFVISFFKTAQKAKAAVAFRT